MKGTFRLYYRAGAVEQPAAGLAYQVWNSSGAVLASGQTGSTGETQPFLGPEENARYELRVRASSGRWVSPETVSGPDAATSLQLPGPATAGMRLQKVRLQPFFQVRFLSHADRKPIAGAKFTAYALEANGKEAIARDSRSNQPITGVTDSNGKTPVVNCAERLIFKFEIAGTPVKVATRRLDPLLPGQPITIYELPLKSVRAMTQPDPQHTAKLAGKTSLPMLISPQDGELIMVGQTDYEDFEETSGRLDKIIAAMHLAKLDMSRALEGGSKADIEAAEKALAGAEDKVKSELNSNFSKSADLKEVITLESYNKGPNSATGASQIGLRRRYLRTDKYMQLRNRRINQAEYKLNIKFAAAAGTQAGAAVSPKTLDVAALKESISKITTSVKSSGKWSTDPKVFDLLELAGNQFADTIVQSESYQVDAQAQWLRLVGCAGANAELDWKGKKAQLQGNLQGKLVLCEGKITGQWAAPSLKGWMIEVAGEDLGAIRFVMELSVYGFAGAKVVASGAVGITLEQGKQVAKAIKSDPKQSFGKLMHPAKNLPRFDPASPYESMPKDLNGLSLGIDAFAGVEAGITPAGKIQWLPPQEKDFVSFAEVSATLAGNAGAGLSGSLAVYYFEGKFRVRAAARICWGLGAKGALEFTVDATKLAEFVKWLSYQLLHAGFRELVYVERIAFQQLSRLLVLLVGEGSPSAERIEEIMGDVDAQFVVLQQQLELAQQRNALVNNINRNPHWLVHATPETRGMLLYQITRHGALSHTRDLPALGGSMVDPEVHYLPSHKKAICTIMKTVQTAAQWDNVMQHMTFQGEKSSRSAGRNEGDVLRFLNNGVSLNEDLPSVFQRLNRTGPVMAPINRKKGTGNTHLDEYLTYRGKLLDKFPTGYRIAALDTPEFQQLALMDGRSHPQFAEVQTLCMGEAYAGEPGSSVA